MRRLRISVNEKRIVTVPKMYLTVAHVRQFRHRLMQSWRCSVDIAHRGSKVFVARVLALNVAHYRAGYGDVPNKESLKDAAHQKNQRRADKDARRPIRGIG